MTIDERLEFLLHSTESLHATCQELHAAVEKHEQRWELLRRVLWAALQAGLRGEDEGEEEGIK
jgi:hypothetical protein